MVIKNIKLKNFRNYQELNLNLSEKTNILTGSNAQGKTNILEAIYLSCVGKSFKGKDKELILSGKSDCKIRIDTKKDYGNYSVEIYLSLNENKKILINDIPILRTGELLGGINAVYFSPDELKLIKDAPNCRRKFLDIDISQLNKNYFYSLLTYNKILLQRNNILKSKDKSLFPMIDIYNEQLSKAAAFIIGERISFITSISTDAKKIHKYITETEELEIYYSPSFDLGENIYESFLSKLKANREKDFRLGYTTIGPHRDDIKILSDNKDVKIYGSQGQQRTCALSLKLSELNYFKQITGEYPVLLLDDVFSELDSKRKNKLIKYCSFIQTIITSADDSETFKDYDATIFKVVKGTVKRV